MREPRRKCRFCRQNRFPSVVPRKRSHDTSRFVSRQQSRSIFRRWKETKGFLRWRLVIDGWKIKANNRASSFESARSVIEQEARARTEINVRQAKRHESKHVTVQTLVYEAVGQFIGSCKLDFSWYIPGVERHSRFVLFLLAFFLVLLHPSSSMHRRHTGRCTCTRGKDTVMRFTERRDGTSADGGSVL